MAIPNFQTFMLPILELHADGQDHARSEIRERMAAQFGLTAADRDVKLPSGKIRTFDNRINWASHDLKAARLLEHRGKGVTRITERGRDLLADPPSALDRKALRAYPEFEEFLHKRNPATPKKPEGETGPESTDTAETAEERIDQAYSELRAALAQQLLDRVSDPARPEFFEKLVLDVLVAMGYGGRRLAEHLGRSGDEGLDGMIREDRLGLDVIYIQAKCWAQDRPIQRKDVQSFVGALSGKQATKGVFITTSRYTDGARRYVESIQPRVILIDGPELAELMIDYGVGVRVTQQYEVRDIDEDYFFDEEGASVVAS